MNGWSLPSLEALFAGAVSGIVARLASALVLGLAVSLIHRRVRHAPANSFSTTLVMLSVLIAMVTQVIGDNVARAFSLVGALSIVRFRTVVRDTQDTAYVIFAVAVGMASGAANLSLALAGLAFTAGAAFLTRPGNSDGSLHDLDVRLNLGMMPETAFGPVLDEHCATLEPLGAQTARQGAAIEVTYRVGIRRTSSPHSLVVALNRVEGVQNAIIRPSEP
jgi:Domain of unknown function (DUF4956)